MDYDDDFLTVLENLVKRLAPASCSTYAPVALRQKPASFHSPEETLRELWLAPLGLAHLASTLVMGGYIDMHSILSLDDEILQVMSDFNCLIRL